MPAFRCEFLGCKVNQYDAERARALLLARGLVDVSGADAPADLVLLAACTVTARAASKGRRALRSQLRARPGLRVAVLGCLTDEDRRLYQSLGGAVTFLPSATDDRFVAELAPICDELGATAAAAPPGSAGGATRRRTRAFLKVEDGCDLRCSFCVIPFVRGAARSRPVDEVVEEAQGLVADGVREIVLTGVHLGHYGRGPLRGGACGSLAQLVRALAALDGDFRIRLSSLEASELSRELVDLFASEPRLVPHLHLPLQSGSERVLRRMRRPYTARLFRERVDALRRRLDDPGLTTDVMVGFPGESDADFAGTVALCRDGGFARLHVFPYSPRAGTDAAALPDPVAPAAVAERRAELAMLDAELRQASLERSVGRRVRIVVEELGEDGARVGYDERYHRTRLVPSARSRGEFASGRAVGCDGETLFAEPDEPR